MRCAVGRPAADEPTSAPRQDRLRLAGMTYSTRTESGECTNSCVVTVNSTCPGPDGIRAELYHNPTGFTVVSPRAQVSMLCQDTYAVVAHVPMP